MNDPLDELRRTGDADVVDAIRLAADAIVAAIEALRLEVRELRKDVAGQ